jgi:hypothetical protein
MDIRRPTTGQGELRWTEAPASTAGHSTASPTQDFHAWERRRRQLGQASVPDDVELGEFIETYRRLHAVPNLSPAARDLYRPVWSLHILPRLGEYGVRELTPKRLALFAGISWPSESVRERP